MAFGLEAGEGEHRLSSTPVILRHTASWLLASTVLCCGSIFISSRAIAQQPVTSSQAGAVSFSIPSQPVPAAINAFIHATGWQVGYSTRITDGVRSKPISGAMPPAQALKALLAGTGINVRFTGPNTATLVSPDAAVGNLPEGTIQLDTIDVQAVNPNSTMTPLPEYAGGQVATGGQLGLLGNRNVMDTPFNQTSYTAKKAQDQQAATIRDVLVDDPSVRISLADAANGYESARSRGFEFLPTGIAYGGLYGILPTESVMTELAERVEILKGPSAMLNGMSPIGGAINIVPKRAPDDGLTQLTTTYASAGQVGGHADLARRFGADKQFGVRFNGVFKGGQTAVEHNSNERGLALLGLDFHGDRVRLSTDLGYQHQAVDGVVPSFGIATGVPLPSAPDASTNPGQPWSTLKRKDLFGVTRAEVDLTEDVTAYAAFGAHDFQGSRYLAWGVDITNVNGNATGKTEYYIYGESYLTGETGLRAQVRTGPIDHEFAVTATTFRQETSYGWTTGPTFATNIYDPTIVARPNIATPVTYKASEQDLSGLAFADTLSIADKRIQLTIGGRLQRVQVDNFNSAGTTTSSYDESAFSPSVALVVKPWRNVSIYGNYIQGLQRGTIVGASYANAGEVFPPYKTEQYETGVKVDWGRFTTTVSLFQITQPSTIAVPGTPLPSLALAGEQRNRGLEFNVFGELATGVRLLGGAMFLDPKLTKTQGGLTDGWTAPFSPTFNLNLGGEWDLPSVAGLTLTGRVVYTGAQYIDTTSPRRTMPAWTRFDLGARYTFDNPVAKGKPLVARLNVENLLDANYWEGGRTSTAMMRGAPRTIRLSLTAEF